MPDRDIRVLIADDQELVRSGFAALIDGAPGFETVGEAGNGVEAVELVHKRAPDVVLMDIRMPVMDGIEATRRITGDPRLSKVKVLILTTFDPDEFVYDALQAGASGFLLKDTPPRRLLDGIEVVAAGDALLAPSITRRLISDFVSRPSSRGRSPQLDGLTERELDVLAQVGSGLSNGEIAEALIMSPLTAKTHVSRIMGKLNARSRAQLVVVAYETGLVTPGAP